MTVPNLEIFWICHLTPPNTNTQQPSSGDSTPSKLCSPPLLEPSEESKQYVPRGTCRAAHAAPWGRFVNGPGPWGAHFRSVQVWSPSPHFRVSAFPEEGTRRTRIVCCSMRGRGIFEKRSGSTSELMIFLTVLVRNYHHVDVKGIEYSWRGHGML
ncbi:hypothetical protein NPIL_74701 [Nephila pilipes]|uniref:Uncharacterized protein n=1 Tax=Nephila pilipes TaxID=299642 RepID=A0A8X6NNG5_NEPPI|nr:hypothetical protein NPIL_74701 [Nephila pilipes]